MNEATSSFSLLPSLVVASESPCVDCILCSTRGQSVRGTRIMTLGLKALPSQPHSIWLQKRLPAIKVSFL